MSTRVESAAAPGLSSAHRESAAEPPKFLPVRYWAVAGGVITAFIVYVLLRWVTGPYFKHVQPGPTPLPGWMKASLVAWQVIMPATWLFFVHRFIVRPWRAERRISVEGLFVIGGTTLAFQDVITNWSAPWIVYNAWMVNVGSWYNDIPGWVMFGSPGHLAATPLLFVPFAHGIAWLVFAMVGRKAIIAIRARRPQTDYLTLAVVTYVLVFVMDAVMEIVIMMPFGLFAYPGGRWPLAFPNTYHMYPASEAIFISAFFTLAVLLYTFRNDKGQTLVERGIDEVRAGPGAKALMQVLAMIAAFQLGLLLVYTVPVITLFGAKPGHYPQDVLKRSYLLDGMCGPGESRACP